MRNCSKLYNIHQPHAISSLSGDDSDIHSPYGGSSGYIGNCEASRPADKKAILERIKGGDYSKFNNYLTDLLLSGDDGLFNQWLDVEAKSKGVGKILRRVIEAENLAASTAATTSPGPPTLVVVFGQDISYSI